MKSVILRIFGIILILVSLLLVCYPFISNYLMGLNQSSEIVAYEQQTDSAGEDEISAELQAAQEYNKTLLGTVMLTDPFDPNSSDESDYEYQNLLNLSGNSVMASIEIPVINVNLPIYHGTSEETLKKGAGHLQKTSLPVGGVGTHSVITGHTGLSSARLFTDLNLLKKDDVFFIHCLGKTLAYQVDQIKVVEPENTDDLRIDPKQDYVTLVTCTPYGINTHRLLVRGKRIPYETAQQSIGESRENESTWMKEYKRAVFIGSMVFVAIIIIYIIIRIVLKRRKIKEENRINSDNSS